MNLLALLQDYPSVNYHIINRLVRFLQIFSVSYGCAYAVRYQFGSNIEEELDTGKDPIWAFTTKERDSYVYFCLPFKILRQLLSLLGK